MTSCPTDRLVSETAVGEIALPDVARLRQFTYRLFAVLFLYPEEERLRALAAAASEMRPESEFSALFPFFNSWQRVLDTLVGPLVGARGAVEEEYRALFLALTSAPACPPYESFYLLNRHGQDTGWFTAQLLQRYKEAGLALAPAMEDVPDHVTVELEFMAFLCGHEELAWEGKVSDSGGRALKRERAFLRRHLGWWFPAFTRRIVVVDRDGFYAGVAEVAEAFIHHDADLIELLLTSSDAAATAEGRR